MTSAARQAEADRVELAYYWALNQLGSAVAADSLELWEQVPATEQAAKSAWWLTRVLRLIFGFRHQGHDLAVAYYRLTRALRTGTTPATGSEKQGDSVSLEKLRQEFEEIVDHIDANTAASAPEVHAGRSQDDDDDEITVERFTDIDALIEQSNLDAQEEAANQLDNLGIGNLLKNLKNGIDPADAHSTAGSRQAAAAMRISMNAARGLTFTLAETDLRVIGWVRYSQTGTPCAFCAMLLSRGIVYKSQKAAVAKENKDGNRILEADGSVAEHNKFHENCHCVAVPVFLQAQYDGNGLFALNRQYDGLWKKHIRNKFRNDPQAALNAWRTYLRKGFPDQQVVQVAA